GFVVGDDEPPAGLGVGVPVEAGAAPDVGVRVLPDERLFGLAVVGVEERGGDGVASDAVGHGAHLLVFGSFGRDGAASADDGDLGFGVLVVPSVFVDEYEVGAGAEDELVRG